MKFNIRCLFLLLIGTFLIKEIRADGSKIHHKFFHSMFNKRARAKKDASQTLKSLAAEMRDRNTLFWLNAIQTRDLELIKELAPHLTETSVKQTTVRTKNEILNDMVNNLQMYDQFVSNDIVQNHKTDVQKQLDKYRSAICTQKYILNSEIIKPKPGESTLVFTQYSKRFHPSQDFIEEIEWHKKQTRLGQNKKNIKN